MKLPNVQCDFCKGRIDANDEHVVVHAQPHDLQMCATCAGKFAAAARFFVRLEQEELIKAEPATKLIC